MKVIIRKKLLTVLLSGGIAISSIAGCSTKDSINSFKYVTTSIEDEDIKNADKLIDVEVTIPQYYDYYNTYKTVDNIKNIISNGYVGNIYIDIGYNVYPSSDLHEKYISYIKDIIEKLAANGIEFTLIGNHWQLDYFTNYNTMAICKDKKKVEEAVEKYGQAYYNGQVYYKDPAKKHIKNNDSQFLEDEKYIVKPGDSLISIAEKYNISDYKGLGLYNNLEDISLIKPGDVIVIPSVYSKQIEEIRDSEDIDEIKKSGNNEEFEETKEIESESNYVEVDEDKYYKGIDVSEHQGYIDWDIAESKIDFAFIRIADTCNKDENGNYILDSYYRRNMKECEERGIPKGLYLYTRAHTEEEMQKEIDFVLESLKDEDGNYYDITRPIYIDVESECAEALMENEEERINEVKLIEMFCSKMEEAGYASGVYINSKYIPKIEELLNTYSIWACGGDVSGYLYEKEQTIDEMYYGYSEEDEYFTSTYGVNIVQTSSCGVGSSVGAESQFVDLDYADKKFFDALDKKFNKGDSRVLHH